MVRYVYCHIIVHNDSFVQFSCSYFQNPALYISRTIFANDGCFLSIKSRRTRHTLRSYLLSKLSQSSIARFRSFVQAKHFSNFVL